MKTTILFFLLVIAGFSSRAQFVAIMQPEEPIPGVCDQKAIYALFPMFAGQVEAECPVTEEVILQRLNSEVQYVKDHPKFKGKGMMGLVINCEGKLVQCEMDNTTKEKELDAQIEAIFNALGEWKVGTLDGKEVDSSLLYSFKIKNGVFTFE